MQNVKVIKRDEVKRKALERLNKVKESKPLDVSAIRRQWRSDTNEVKEKIKLRDLQMFGY